MFFLIIMISIFFLQPFYVQPKNHKFINKNQITKQNSKKQNKKHMKSKFLIPYVRENAGMFSIFDDVIDLLNRYEMGMCSGLEINFGKKGLYYDPDHGDNWWSYYCNEINLGKRTSNNVFQIQIGSKLLPETKTMLLNNRKKVHKLITKYMHIKNYIKQKIFAFAKKHFYKKFVISVHYRGTDKYTEAPPLSYQEVSDAVDEILKKINKKSYKIFIASDEQGFIDHMIKRFGSYVCYNKDAFHSTDNTPVHSDLDLNRYKCGEDAIIDCVLLSMGDFLIRCSSNLSRWSTYFNPKIPVLLLNSQFNWVQNIQN